METKEKTALKSPAAIVRMTPANIHKYFGALSESDRESLVQSLSESKHFATIANKCIDYANNQLANITVKDSDLKPEEIQQRAIEMYFASKMLALKDGLNRPNPVQPESTSKPAKFVGSIESSEYSSAKKELFRKCTSLSRVCKTINDLGLATKLTPNISVRQFFANFGIDSEIGITPKDVVLAYATVWSEKVDDKRLILGEYVKQYAYYVTKSGVHHKCYTQDSLDSAKSILDSAKPVFRYVLEPIASNNWSIQKLVSRLENCLNAEAITERINKFNESVETDTLFWLKKVKDAEPITKPADTAKIVWETASETATRKLNQAKK